MKKEIWNDLLISDQINKIFIITGPTSGLGKETLRILSRKNATVIMAARDIKKAKAVKNEMLSQNKNGKIDIQELDLSSLESINNFSEAIKKKYNITLSIEDKSIHQHFFSVETLANFINSQNSQAIN